MGARGRLAQTDNVRQLRGNPGKRRSQPRPQAVPAIPGKSSLIKGEALAEWNRVTPELERLGLLANIDRAVLTMYCITWARWVELEKILEKEGLIVAGQRKASESVRHPAWPLHHQATAKVMELAGLLGLAPSPRLRMSPPKRDDDSGSDLD